MSNQVDHAGEPAAGRQVGCGLRRTLGPVQRSSEILSESMVPLRGRMATAVRHGEEELGQPNEKREEGGSERSEDGGETCRTRGCGAATCPPSTDEQGAKF